MATKTEYLKRVPSTASLKNGGINDKSSQNNASTFSGMSLFNQFGFNYNNSNKRQEINKEKKKAIQARWEQFRESSNKLFDEESSETDSEKKSSSNSKRSAFDRRKKSPESHHRHKTLEVSDNGNLSKSMSNDQKNGFLEVGGLSHKHDV
jgi:pyruvate/2-oxoacid:ferredoxin oxidoreductase beta subunit